MRDIHFSVPVGGSVAIVGPSGSGKTTLLSLIGGLLAPQRGVSYCTDRHGERHSIAAHATWVLQTVSLLPERTVVDNVAIGAYSSGASRDEATKRSRACLKEVGLDHRASEPARILSGGEAQRVAIARALASRRPILLADEPTGQLDATTSGVVLDAMMASSLAPTVVVVTHDPAVAARCSLVVELRDGQVYERARA
ncbi:ABC transporter ATP-binding protein [Demequina sp.]|uniref:ABC transporter ATP-binding protein n=1 Tax=Demequina sp. TaxID=2050685 RepID=UPI003A89A1D1